jgi:hypothetical protein
MKIILTERQINSIQKKIFEDDPLKYFCSRTEEGSPFCKLLQLRSTEKNEEIVNNFNKNFLNLLRFFYPKFGYRYQKSLLRDILVEFLNYDEERVFSFVDLLGDFVSQEKFSNSKTKEALVLLKRAKKKINPEKLADYLKNIRYMGYTEYEDSFVGDDFIPHKTKLSLSYKCNDELDETLYELINQIKTGSKEINDLISKMKDCLNSTLSINKDYIKSDIKSKRDLYVIENDKKVKIFSSGDLFEVKKFDYEVDSYLSEFFSIFKSSKLSPIKSNILPTYNKIIQEIYEWINKSFPNLPQKIGDAISGIVFDNNVIIPSKYIEYYWSNKGQRGCNELRLSIRFRVKPEFNKIEGYIYTQDSEILEKTTKEITKTDREKIICY